MQDASGSTTLSPEAFIERWRGSGAAEQANSQLFLGELCDLLGVPRPEPTKQDDAANAYVFEKGVTFNNGDGTTSFGRIDLYRRGCFVLESKQGSERKQAEEEEALSKVVRKSKQKSGTAPRGTKAWDQAMSKARQQARRYAEALPDEWPPLLVVCDVGYCIDVFADFARTGKNYAPFPDPQSYRIRLEQLADGGIRERLKLAWVDPLALDPGRRSAKVTRELAAKLAELAKRLERREKSSTTGASAFAAAPGTPRMTQARDGGVRSPLIPGPSPQREGSEFTGGQGEGSEFGFSGSAGETFDRGFGHSSSSPGHTTPGTPSSVMHTPDEVAQFLMRCLFTVFAEDVGLIPKNGFHDLLISLRESPENFAPMAESLWATMDTGGFSPILRQKLLRFNGGLFADRSALPLDRDQLELLIEASEAEWSEVEPAIFGTLLERALDPRERHKLGAHYTPRAYVERLVVPTIMEPLRGEWEDVYAAAVQLDSEGKTKEAIAAVREFHGKLCEVRILDPACGSGNFLYVSLELIKRLEGEVLNALKEFGDRETPLLTVDPHQFLGIELNPRAAAIADLVLWIGYLQWHFRTRGKTNPPEPVLHNFHNIECRDAVLAHDGTEPVLDEEGKPVTRWDGRTTKTHPVTGEQVPDETARVPVLRYKNPRKAEWPEADYVVGNPPFIGNKRMRFALGDGYVEALRIAYTDVSGHVDFVMFWWDKAAVLMSKSHLRQFGFITTNSMHQTASRSVLERHLQGTLGLAFAIPDHPWVDESDGAAVRIAMTVVGRDTNIGTLQRITRETEVDAAEHQVEFAIESGTIGPNLQIGAGVSSSAELSANRGLSFMGMTLVGDFRLSEADLALLGISRKALPPVVRRYLNGKDVAQTSQNRYVIDLFGLSSEQAREKYPALFQRILDFVKPLRDENKRKAYRDRYWIFGEPRPALRDAIRGLDRYIVTGETARHRFFTFLGPDTTPDHKLYVIASDDPFLLGVLSSRIHVKWALAAGGRLGVGNDPTWTNSTCFLPFSFPACSEAQQEKIRELAEALDAHRKRQQGLHPGLTMTGMYNVLEKLRSGEALTAKEKQIHEQGLVSVLKQLHDDLDAAVAEAYGWPVDLSDEEILERLVALNKERAAEEARGLVRWLRPEFQNPQGETKTQKTIVTVEEPEAKPTKAAKVAKRPWPTALAERFQLIRAALHEGRPLSADEAAKRFTRAKKETVAELLDTLVALGQARQLEDGRYVG